MVGSGPSTWIRPVSDRQHEEVSYSERQYHDGSDPSLLDIIDIPVLAARPKDYQSENYLLDAQQYWKKSGKLPWTDLAQLVDDVPELWSNGDSTYHGCNDRVGLQLAKMFDYSLALIHVDEISIRVFAPGRAFNNAKRRVQGEFSHNDVLYRLWVTDPIIEKHYLAGGDGEFSLGEAYLTISLGEPKDDECYKLIAAIITPGNN